VTAPFRISGGPLLPIGVYEFNEGIVQLNGGAQRAVSGRLTITAGEFFSGHRQQLEYSGRVKVSSQLAFEPAVLTSHILAARRRRYDEAGRHADRPTPSTPRMFVSGPRAIQLEPEHARIEYPLALGISARQRSVRRLYRRARHVRFANAALMNRGVRDQGDAAASLLILTFPDCRAA
jgi:hypothetical protein